MTHRTIRHSLIGRTVAVVLILAFIAIAWRGVSLWFLSRAADARVEEVDVWYRNKVETTVGPLLTGNARLTTRQREAVTALTGSADADRLDRQARMTAILETQRGLIRFAEATTGTALAARPDVDALLRAIASTGDIQPLLNAYNQRAQAWNNARVSGLGAIFAGLLRLQPRILLTVNGTAEYETTVQM